MISLTICSASKSEYADLLVEYVEAERVGQGTHGPGECFPYYKECPRSFFKSPSHKYRLDYYSIANLIANFRFSF